MNNLSSQKNKFEITRLMYDKYSKMMNIYPDTKHSTSQRI